LRVPGATSDVEYALPAHRTVHLLELDVTDAESVAVARHGKAKVAAARGVTSIAGRVNREVLEEALSAFTSSNVAVYYFVADDPHAR
jgi:hypothetical protein